MIKQKFSRKHRLKTSGEYREVFLKAKKITLNGFAAYIVKNPLNYPRLGVIVSKKKVRRAIDRNRIKRLIRESFRTLDWKSSMDVVVIVHHEGGSLSKPEMANHLRALWQKVKQFCKDF